MDVWNGAPALYRSATTRQEKANRALRAVSRREYHGLPRADNGEQEATRISLREMPFSLTGTATAEPIMWEL